MATYLKRLEFRARYPSIQQGLFITLTEKRLPKGQEELNLGQTLSDALYRIPAEDRPGIVAQAISRMVSPFRAVTLTHLNILFTPTFRLDVVRLLLSMCRNRKVCIAWPGTMLDGKLFYATPDSPEYYECDPRALQDTYIIID